MTFCENLSLAWKIIPKEFLNTLYMVFVSTLLATLLGLPIGTALHLTGKAGLKPNRFINKLLGFCVNVLRAIPFAILIIAIFPFTRWIVGTSIGTTASIVPLTLAAAPLIARLVEAAFKEIEIPVIEAAVVMGSTTSQIVQKVFLPEALPGLINGVTLTVINLIGYSAMAGLVGGGGLGKVAIQYGYQRFNGFLMLVTLVLLLALVEITQWTGSSLSKAIGKKRGKS
ncbi:MAG: D-methionine transport system permease protein MetI [Chlamydiales bacterium]|nr:D-methionine transport system permease protein MetI [Chlamydiales bacterium]